MLSIKNYRQKLESKLIHDFKEAFYQKTGKSITVLVDKNNMESEWLYIKTLDKLEELFYPFVQAELYSDIRVSKPVSLKSRSRSRSLVYLRMIFSQYARSMGYTYTEIGRYLKRDHTTILHNINQLRNLVSVQDEIFLQLFNRVNDHMKTLHIYNESEQALPDLGTTQANPEPVVFAMLP